jgi:ectoine hydroxylase-related dioxygenase (phytanoyl-CoA dioxygenase family)
MHKWFREIVAESDLPEDVARQLRDVGYLIIYNGSVWHGHTANWSARSRRSIQGAFIRRGAQSAVNHAARIHPETLDRIGGLAKYLLDLEPNDCPQA